MNRVLKKVPNIHRRGFLYESIKRRKDNMGKHVLRTGKVGRPPQINPSKRTLYMRMYMRTYQQKKDDEYYLNIGYWWSRRFLC